LSGTGGISGVRLGVVAAAALALGACAGGTQTPQPQPQAQAQSERPQGSGIFREDSILNVFLGGGGAEGTVAVNRFIWAAALDTLAFLPLEGADPFTGVIVTDWGRVGADPSPYRVTVLITEPALDARSLRVAAFRQQGGRAVPVADADNRQIENAILTRARELRIAELGR
jgi:hypothetical protein